MEIKITGNRRNELLKRNEVIFIASHEGGPTPSRTEVREKLAKILNVSVDRVYIRRMEAVTGSRTTVGEAHVYDTPEHAVAIEPKHIMARSAPQGEKGR